MLFSLACNNACHLDIFLLHSELDNDDITMLSSYVIGYDVALHPLKTEPSLFSNRILTNDLWSMEACYRLLLPELLPDDTERILYLDGDVIVNKSLERFYQTDFCGNDLICTVNSCGENVPEDYGPKHQEMFAPMYANGYRYFCSGVLLFNIAEIRKKYSFQTYLDAMNAWDYQMEAPDQDILNWVHGNHVSYADWKQYNMFARIAHNNGWTYETVKEQCSIVHFAGDKPWTFRNVHFDIEKLWWDYAIKTPACHSLLEDFMTGSFLENARVESYIINLEKRNKDLQNSLHQASDLLKKLLNMNNAL